MISIKKLILALLLTMILFISGCGGEESFTVYFVDDVNNLDPQFAHGSSEKNILYNLFDGLFYINEWGEAVPDLVSDYEIHGNKYTFTLKDDIFWQDGTELVAQDFVFGIKRLFDGSDGAILFSGISGAMEFLEGSGSKDDIAVYATDDKTLVIELEKADPNFLKLLSDPYAYPCNEKFFVETKGRYGLYEDALLTNGDYTLQKFGSSSISLAAVYDAADITVYLNRDDGVLAVENGDCDVAYIDGDGEIETKSNLITVESGVSVLIFNSNSEEFAVREVREAFIKTMDLEAILVASDLAVNEPFSLIPNSVTVDGGFYKVEEYLTAPEQLASAGGDLLNAALMQNFDKNTLSSFEIYVKSQEEEMLLSAVMQRWQRDLNAFGSLKYQSLSAFNSTIASGNFDIAIITIEASGGDPSDILRVFSEGYRGYEFYQDEQYSSLLDRAIASGEAEDFIAAEQYLIDDYIAYPISFTESRLLLSNNISSLSYSPGFHYIDFSTIE